MTVESRADAGSRKTVLRNYLCDDFFFLGGFFPSVFILFLMDESVGLNAKNEKKAQRGRVRLMDWRFYPAGEHVSI